MTNQDDARTRFQKDTASHTLKVLKDDGVYRHLRCAKDGSSAYYFDIVTWPGYLTVSGDMGCFVFARTRDMFEFFRTDRDINPSYWSEKLQAPKRVDGNAVKEFSRERFDAVVESYVQNHVEANELDAAASAELRMELANDFEYVDSGESAYSAINDSGVIKFDDFWEHDLRDYTFHFLWICHAILWAISQYDSQVKVAQGTEAGG